ncbi:hypothetical protein ACSQ67_005788 [Phaseolus vulgaris]
MERRGDVALFCLALFFLSTSVVGLLSPKGVNYEVQALMSIKNSLMDPHSVLGNWDADAVDPCNWAMVTCSSDHFVTALGIPSQNISGRLSPSIGSLTNLLTVLLQDNNITGPIPSEIGKLQKLQTLDLSDNFFTGQLPDSLSQMKGLHYLRLNNNSLTGPIPSSLANMTQLAFLDISHNNLSESVPRINAKTFNIVGNPQICATGVEQNCFRTTPIPSAPNNSQDSRSTKGPKSHKVALAFASSISCIGLLILGLGFLIWWRQRHNKQIFFDVNDGNAIGGEIQFQTEVEMISLAVHRNLLRLYGFCMTTTERLLVYPYMSNGSVASRLKAKPALDWPTRKRIALGAGRGLLALEFGKAANQKGAMLDWVKKIHQEKKIDLLVDKDLKNHYDRIELDEIVQVALLCTQYLPSHRPKMSEVVRMLEGDGLAEKWEASQRAESTRSRGNELSSSERYSDLTDDSSLLTQAMELSGPR